MCMKLNESIMCRQNAKEQNAGVYIEDLVSLPCSLYLRQSWMDGIVVC